MGPASPAKDRPKRTAAHYNRSLHRFVVLAAVFGLVRTITDGRTIAFAVAFSLLSVIMTVWLWVASQRRETKILGVIALGGSILAGVLGLLPYSAPRWLAMFEDCLAPIVFGLLVALAVLTSDSWHRGPQPVLDAGWPSLGSLSITAAALIFLDSLFGSAFRHQLLGPVLHIAGAMAGAVVVAMLCIFILTQHSAHKSLRQSALALLVVTSVQVFLGIAEYMLRLWSAGSAATSGSAVPLGAIHSAVGALTLAAGVALAIQVSRHVRKPAVLPLSSPHSLGTV
jgi:hypothetical protein